MFGNVVVELHGLIRSDKDIQALQVDRSSSVSGLFGCGCSLFC